MQYRVCNRVVQDFLSTENEINRGQQANGCRGWKQMASAAGQGKGSAVKCRWKKSFCKGEFMNKILVVDDEIEICLLVTQYLKKMGFDASYALSIADALSKISLTSYDLLFVDLNLTSEYPVMIITATAG